MPVPPYRNPFSNPATLESVLLTVDRRGDDLHCTFVPTVMVHGIPRPPDETRAAAVLDRLGDSTSVRRDTAGGLTAAMTLP